MEWINGKDNKVFSSPINEMWIVTDEENPKIIATLPKVSITLAKGYKVIDAERETYDYSLEETVNGLSDLVLDVSNTNIAHLLKHQEDS